MDLGRRDIGELRHPATDVCPVRIEPLALAGGVEDPEERLRVGPGRRGPLPAAVVRGDIAVDQVMHEVGLARAPIDEQVLRQERRGDHPSAVRQPAGGGKLAHRGIDDRVAGPAGPPRIEGDVVARPRERVELRPEGRPADGRSMEEDVGVEVTPGEFGQEPAPALALARGTLGDLGRRQEAEVEVGRDARGPIGEVEPIAGLVVAVDTVRDPAFEAPAGSCLARLGQQCRIGRRAVAEAER